MGIPVIVVNHAVSEEAGLMNLARHLSERYPAVPVHHVPQRCMYQLIGVNIGSVEWAGGGLTHNLYTQLMEKLPPEYATRQVDFYLV
jgi:hypothetical protein